jgi:hypothetical protein
MAGRHRFTNSGIAAKLTKSTKTLQKGHFHDMTNMPRRNVALKTCGALQELGYMAQTTSNDSTQRIFYEMFHSLGYTIETSQQNFSLIDEATILNYEQGQPVANVDDNLPQAMDYRQFEFLTTEEAKTLDLVYAGALYAREGLLKKKPKHTLRYFSNKEMSKALKGLKR